MSKLINYELKRVQITCPNCKHEFPYNKNALDKKIALNGKRIDELNQKLKYINSMPKDKINKEEYNRIKYLCKAYSDLNTDYKLIRETLHDNEDLTIFNNLKLAIKEIYGDEAYKLCMDKALRESNAYTTEKNMRNWY